MKKAAFILLALLFSTGIFAQRSEIGVMGGISYYMGDINTSKLFYKPNFMGGIVYRYNFNPRWAFKMNAIYGKIEGDDKDFGNIRNLNFRSRIVDLSAQIELNFLPYFTGSKKARVAPYIFTGLALFSFNPQTDYVDPLTKETQTVDLQPLSTEGQGTIANPNVGTYSLTQLAVPFGLGCKISLSKIVCLGFEWSYRMTFTDYLDDISGKYVDRVSLGAERGEKAVAVADRTPELLDPNTLAPYSPNEAGAQRGNSNTKDWYSFVGISLTFKLNMKGHNRCDAYGGSGNYRENIYR